MKFQNALVAMEQGYKVQRESTKNRLNGVCLYMKDGKIYAEQTHDLSAHKTTELFALNVSQILAKDWTTR